MQDAVAHVVDSEDPEGLLAISCPPDEYQPEIRDLTALVHDGGITAGAVLAVWEHWFGPESALLRHPDALARITARLAALQTGG